MVRQSGRVILVIVLQVFDDSALLRLCDVGEAARLLTCDATSRS